MPPKIHTLAQIVIKAPKMELIVNSQIFLLAIESGNSANHTRLIQMHYTRLNPLSRKVFSPYLISVFLISLNITLGPQ